GAAMAIGGTVFLIWLAACAVLISINGALDRWRNRRENPDLTDTWWEPFVETNPSGVTVGIRRGNAGAGPDSREKTAKVMQQVPLGPEARQDLDAARQLVRLLYRQADEFAEFMNDPLGLGEPGDPDVIMRDWSPRTGWSPQTDSKPVDVL